MPLIGINDGGGARVQEGVVALHYYGGIFRRNVAASGVVPQISVIMGSCAGGAVYSPAITDFVFMVKGTSQMFITGPDVVKTVTGEDVTSRSSAGPSPTRTKSGVASFVAPDEKSCLDQVRQLLAYLPSNNLERPPVAADGDDPATWLPELADLVPAVSAPALRHEALAAGSPGRWRVPRVPPPMGLNLVCGFGRIGGRVVGRGGQPTPGARRSAGHRRLPKRVPALCGPAIVSISRS